MAVPASIRPARYWDTEDLDLCRTLMREYATQLNASVGTQHICVTALEKELTQLPHPYAPLAGALLLAFHEAQPAGMVALRPLPSSRVTLMGEKACEMKRLWVRPAFQGLGLGRQLAEAVLKVAHYSGYTAIYLDTLPATMERAFALYRAIGFAPVEVPPEALPGPEVLFLRRSL